MIALLLLYISSPLDLSAQPHNAEIFTVLCRGVIWTVFVQAVRGQQITSYGSLCIMNGGVVT